MVPKLSRFEPSGLSRMRCYAGEYHNLRPKPKTIRELKVALDQIWEDLPQDPINKAIKTLQGDSELGPTVFRGPRNFEPSRGKLCFSRNFEPRNSPRNSSYPRNTADLTFFTRRTIFFTENDLKVALLQVC